MSAAGEFAPVPFVPRRGFRNGHVQTILGNFLPRPDRLPPASPELVEVAPATPTQPASHVLCHCHWQPEDVRAERLTVILLHGLEGSSRSQYVVGSAGKLWRASCNVVRMNMRNCGGTESLSPTLYHSGLSNDVRAVMAAMVERFRLRRVALIGYSMGGNLVLKLAGELGAQPLSAQRLSAQPLGAQPLTDAASAGPQPELCAVAAVSPALDLAQSADALHLWRNRIYERRFLRALIQRFLRKVALFPQIYDPTRARGLRSLRDFDERVTAFYAGFAGASDYYFRASAARVLETIAVPTLILHALDDPFIRLTPESRAKIAANPWITLIEPGHGGHCAFLATPHPAQGDDGYWAESTVLAFLKAQPPPADPHTPTRQPAHTRYDKS